MMDAKTILAYLALVLSAVFLVAVGVAAGTCLYLHLWVAALLYSIATVIMALSFRGMLRSFSI